MNDKDDRPVRRQNKSGVLKVARALALIPIWFFGGCACAVLLGGNEHQLWLFFVFGVLALALSVFAFTGWPFSRGGTKR